MLQCVAVFCSVLQRVAVCCTVLQCVVAEGEEAYAQVRAFLRVCVCVCKCTRVHTSKLHICVYVNYTYVNYIFCVYV